MIKDFKYYQSDRKVYTDEIKNNIPDKVIDFHVHIWKKEFLSKDIDPIKKERDPFFNFDVIDEFTFDDFNKISKSLFPDTEYEGLFFGAPFEEVKIDDNNQMIGDEITRRRSAGLFIPRADDNIEYIEDNIKANNFYGFKPYPDLAIGKKYRHDQDSVSIMDFITEEQLKLANKYRLIVLLHIPKSNRLRDKKNIEDIINISKSYPGLKLILAHAGRAYCVYDLIDDITKINKLDNVFVDTAVINNWEVIEILLEKLGSEKIIFGSDLPITALRGKNICINNKHYFFTANPYPWSVSNKNLEEKNITFFLYEEIREIIKAVSKRKSDKKVIENIFYNNAKRLIDGILCKKDK